MSDPTMTKLEKAVHGLTGFNAFISQEADLLDWRRWSLGYEALGEGTMRSHFIWCGPWYIVFGRDRR